MNGQDPMTQRLQKITKRVSRTMIIGFEGTTIPYPLEEQLRAGFFGGLILFKRNVTSASQVHDLLTRAGVDRKSPILLSVDQEGGRVARLGAPLTVLPPMRTLGSMNDFSLTRQVATLVGLELRAIGFNLNFAPVLDVDTHPDSPVIGDRSFSAHPEEVTDHGAAFGLGLVEGGIFPCAKHFPGHGDAALDSHLTLPTVSHELSRLTRVEMAPFKSWIERRVGAVMTAHVMYPALDADLPATLSRPIIQSYLRQGLGFQGVLFSDDLEMGAMETFGNIGEVAVKAMAAGVDGLLVCRSETKQAEVMDALTRHASKDRLFEHRIEEAIARLEAISIQHSRHPFNWVGSASHQQMQSRLIRAFQ